MTEQMHVNSLAVSRFSGRPTVSQLHISRIAEIPDELRVARARSLPGLGPRLLFFSGGSALNGISRRLKAYTHNSIHLMTPFDSGGSSQVLRTAFDMPAVGDLRSRLMALADESDLGQPDIFALFTHRFPVGASRAKLEREFAALLDTTHPLMDAVSQPMRSLILSHLRAFAAHCPQGFDFAGASVGNLILAGGYLTHDRALEPVLFIMSKMVAVQGTVRSIIDSNLGLGAVLADGQTVVGQREITGKEVPPIAAPIRELFLTRDGARLERNAVKLPKRNRRLIERADLICYPPGSLFTSVIANLLPRGVGRSVAQRAVPKVYFPSLGADPECLGMDLPDQVRALLAALRADAGQDCPADRLLTAVVCDKRGLRDADVRRIHDDHGLPCVGLDLCGAEGIARYDPARFCDALVSLV